jgi:hypothetical protein
MCKKTICAIVFILVALIQCRQSEQMEELDARIMRVENGVLPAVVVKGKTSG